MSCGHCIPNTSSNYHNKEFLFINCITGIVIYLFSAIFRTSGYNKSSLFSANIFSNSTAPKAKAAASKKKVTGKNKATLDDTDAALAKDFNFDDIDAGKSQLESFDDLNNGELSRERRALVDVDQAVAGKFSSRDGYKQALAGHDANSAIKRSHGKHRAGRVRAMALPRHPFCHRGLYEYAFWITIVEYIMIIFEVLFFLSIFCGCCPFAVVPYAEGTAPK